MNQHFVERKNCPACEGTNARTLYRCSFTEEPVWGYIQRHFGWQGYVEREVLEGADYALDLCEDCGLVYQRFIGDDYVMHKIYAEWINPEKVIAFHQEHNGLQYYERLAQEVMMLIKYFDKRPHELRFFDFGMGWCEWSLMSQGMGVKTYGAEVDPARIEFAQARGIEVVPYDEIPGKEFDFINTEQVFEHLPNPLDIVRHLKKGLRKGGLLKISVPYGNTAAWTIKRADWSRSDDSKLSPMPFAPLEHINTYPTATLKAMGRRAGLEPVRIPIGVWIVDLRLSAWKESLRVLLGPIKRRFNPRGAYVLFKRVR